MVSPKTNTSRKTTFKEKKSEKQTQVQGLWNNYKLFRLNSEGNGISSSILVIVFELSGAGTRGSTELYPGGPLAAAKSGRPGEKSEVSPLFK